ncbi:MAG: HAD family hydrolase [Clostridia bacterium]|nr:HAD family hydrolase [Clostridia bacterium]
METYAVFLDIDGTLTCDNTIPRQNVQAIKRARQSGHYVFYNTGRSYGFIPQFCKAALELDGFVAGIGSHVVCSGTELKKERLSYDEILSVTERFLPTGRFVIFEGENESVAFGPERGDPNTHMIKSVQELKKYENLPLTKGYITGVLNESEQNWFKSRYNFFQHENYCEYALKGCSKSSGMELILNYLGIPKERCIAMGDSINDADMLAFAGISVAMENACESIKDICSMITASNADAGVAKALYSILDI